MEIDDKIIGFIDKMKIELIKKSKLITMYTNPTYTGIISCTSWCLNILSQ